MRALAFFLAFGLLPLFSYAQHVHDEAASAPMNHEDMHALPPGTGPSADGSAWLRADETGAYTLPGVTVLGFTFNPMLLRAGMLYRVMPHEGKLTWTKPNGKTEEVPLTNLYPTTPVRK